MDGNAVTDSYQIANEFNSTFHGVFSSRCTSEETIDSVPLFPIMRDIDLNIHGIRHLLLNLDVKKSCGPDGIPHAFLKRYAEMISQYLYVIFKTSLDQGCLPPDWLCGKVVPVHKDGSKLLAENYRPISLISTCCKLLEHVIASHISFFLDSHNILANFQHKFRKRLSTTTQLLSVVHDFGHAINNREQIDAIFLDLSKAFDRVPHHLLLIKLQQVGIAPRLVTWIAAYLKNRVQFVEINRCQSVHLDVLSGVPQGSVLGPLLFLVYVNDIADNIDTSVTVKMFADDCVVYRTVRNTCDQVSLNENFCKIAEWCERWRMVINYSKTCALTVTHKKYPLSFAYHVKDKCIKTVNEVKYLGLHLNSKLNWETHIDSTTAKAYKKLCYLRRKLGPCDSSVKLSAYKSLIRPVLEYASIVWDPYLIKDIGKVERIQRLSARFISSDFRRLSSVSDMIRNCGLESLESRRKIARLVFFL